MDRIIILSEGLGSPAPGCSHLPPASPGLYCSGRFCCCSWEQRPHRIPKSRTATRNAQMAMSGMQTASIAGVSMSGVLAIFRNWEGDYFCFPGTPYLPELQQELDGLPTVHPGSQPSGRQPCFSCATQLGALPLQEGEQTLPLSCRRQESTWLLPRKKEIRTPSLNCTALSQPSSIPVHPGRAVQALWVRRPANYSWAKVEAGI